MTTTKACPECTVAWGAIYDGEGWVMPDLSLSLSLDDESLYCPNSACDYTEPVAADAMMRLLDAPTLPGFGE